ncbi:hypothetical protein ACHAWF_004837, partial [Thalassiosira exigua]
SELTADGAGGGGGDEGRPLLGSGGDGGRSQYGGAAPDEDDGGEADAPSAAAAPPSSLLPAAAAPSSPSSASRRSSLRRKLFRARRDGSSRRSVASSSSRREDPVVLAAEDSSLPPDTPLLGSSRIVAKAIRRAEREALGEEGSGAGIGRARGVSWGGSFCDGDDDCDCDGSELASRTGSTLRSSARAPAPATLRSIEEEYLEKTRTTFFHDAITFAEGTIPQSIAIAFCVGVVCGAVAFLYYTLLEFLLDLIWKEMPRRFVIDRWPEHLYVLWIPLVTLSLALCCGLSIYYLGEPGDLAHTIHSVHEKGYKGTSHMLPMVAASQCTILAGASLGPEAPLVAICAATAGFLSRKVFKQRDRNVVRKHTLMGMSGALAAFFGVPLGGSLFALEVTSRFGVEYFEHAVEAIFAGEICVVVFRSLAGLTLRSIWTIGPEPMTETRPIEIVLGAGLGLLGAGAALAWAHFHWRLMDLFDAMGLLDDENACAVPRALVAAIPIAGIGMLVPQTMFWGEYEIGAIATPSPASDLPHVWPTSGLLGFEMDSMTNCLIVGLCKLVAISLAVAGGFRGGYIFPFFAAGAAFGRAFCFVFPDVSPSVAALCLAAGINVAITRTSLATTLILTSLADEPHATPVVLAASLVSLFATGYVPFIKSQLARSDIDFSLYYRRSRQPKIQDSLRSKTSHTKDISDDDLQLLDHNLGGPKHNY